MPAGYSSQPVSGFTGHMPGAKWQVGRRYVPPTAEQQEPTRTDLQPQQDHSFGPHPPVPSFRNSGNEVHFSHPEHLMVDEGTQSEMSFRQDVLDPGVSYVNGIGNEFHRAASQAPFLSPGSSNFSMGFDAQGRPVHLSKQQQQHAHFHPNAGQGFPYQQEGTQNFHGNQGIAYGEPHPRASQPGYDSEGRQIQVYHNNGQITEFPSQTGHLSRSETSATGRSRSLPRRRIEKDPFEGVESGWWSKGEVMRNKERREMAEKGKTITGGDWSAAKMEVSPPRRVWKERDNELQDIPTAGYSGHIQGLRQIQVGKPFHRAAKEAKEQYVERRRARSGGREQFYSNSGSQFEGAGSEQLNYAHSVVSGMHARSAY